MYSKERAFLLLSFCSWCASARYFSFSSWLVLIQVGHDDFCANSGMRRSRSKTSSSVTPFSLAKIFRPITTFLAAFSISSSVQCRMSLFSL